MKQSQFFKASPRSHGGVLNKKKRKGRRPIDTKKPLHVVMRSTKATKQLSFIRHHQAIKEILRANAERFRISIYSWANSGNHLHLLIRGKSRGEIQNFLRTVTALIARRVTGAKKGNPFKGKFWDQLVFTRLLNSWQREFRVVMEYINLNIHEALGLAKRVTSGANGNVGAPGAG
jgi:REP element-mobilizing transposase RayT